MEQRLKLILAILMTASLIGLVGCKQPEVSEQKEITLRIAGSGSGMTILKLLQEPFEKEHPGTHLDFLPSTSTGDAITGVSEGLLNFGSAARKMKDSEKEEYPDVTEFTYVKDAMVLCVNPGVGIDSLTKEQIRKIYAGEITDWSGIGNSAGRIVVLDREESDSSKIMLRENILGQNLTVTSDAIEFHNAESMHRAVEETEGTIGQCSLGSIKAENLSVKPLALDGIVASKESIQDGSYLLVREYGILARKDRLTRATKEFVEFIFSDAARQILGQYGYLPVPRQ